MLKDTSEFVDDLIAWKKKPASRGDLEEWYNEVYLPMGRGAPPAPSDPLGRHPEISNDAAQMIRKVGEAIRQDTAREGVEFAAMVDVESGAELGARLRGVEDGVIIAPHLEAMVPGRRYVQIHTHPASSAFSPQDAAILVQRNGVAAIHVVGEDGTRYLLSKRANGELPSIVKLTNTYTDEVYRLMDKYRPRVQPGELDQKMAWKEHTHEVWTRIAGRLNLIYERWGEHGE